MTQPLTDTQIKHLELVQGVIGRLATNSFLMKGWVLTIAGVIFGFAVDQESWRIAAVAMLPVIAFWGLDAYFLRQERLYRGLYDAVRQSAPQVEPFSMNIQDHVVPVESWLATAFSRTLLPFYGIVVLFGAILILAGAFQS